MGVTVERQVEWEITDQNRHGFRFILSLEDAVFTGHAYIGDVGTHFLHIPAEDVLDFYLALGRMLERKEMP